MSAAGWREPPKESIGTEPAKLREVRAQDLIVRFAFGAATSAVAGGVRRSRGPGLHPRRLAARPDRRLPRLDGGRARALAAPLGPARLRRSRQAMIASPTKRV